MRAPGRDCRPEPSGGRAGPGLEAPSERQKRDALDQNESCGHPPRGERRDAALLGGKCFELAEATELRDRSQVKNRDLVPGPRRLSRCVGIRWGRPAGEVGRVVLIPGHTIEQRDNRQLGCDDFL